MINLEEITNRIINDGYQVTESEALELLRWPDANALYAAADKVRAALCGDFFDTCSIINARSGRCSEDCKWCSQSHKHHTGINEYPLIGVDEAMQLAKRNDKAGVHRYSLVTSGRTMTDSQIDKAADIYKALGKETKLFLCASMGLLTKPQLQKLYDAGVRRYHCNIESAPSYFPKLCTTHTTAEKVQTIKWAREVGMEVCSGGIIGMGESEEQRVEMACYLREIGVDSIPMNVLMPIKGTALENQPPLEEEEILRSAAMFRLVNPKANIRMAGGRASYWGKSETALKCGMNSSIVGDMLTTTGAKSIEEDMEKITDAGYKTTI
ncbi:MAG: biotin synthase BioB [Bacteroidia bacterium]|nr:biotin synthase BioB [Bacteroidia bacterium]